MTKKSLYSIAMDGQPHTWSEIVSASNQVADLTNPEEEDVYFKEAVSIGKDIVVIWREQGDFYVKKKIFVTTDGI